MEDWTHRDMYHVCILPGRSGVQAGAAQHQFCWILGQCQALLNGGGPDQAVSSCDVSIWGGGGGVTDLDFRYGQGLVVTGIKNFADFLTTV
jgi:hypothetical protein